MKWLTGMYLLLLTLPLQANELRPAYLQVTETQPNIFSILWKVPARNNQQRLSLAVEFEPEPAIVQKPLQGFEAGYHLRTWKLDMNGDLPGTMISIEGLARTSTEVLLRIEYLDGTSLTHRFTPSSTTYKVAEKPTLLQTAYTYLKLGIEHILLGFDHLLFVLALLLLIDNMRKLILTVTFFTLAHSITLSLAALKIIHVPVPPVEAVIALSIVFVASEIIRVQQGHSSLTYRKPWVVAFIFGLLHGLGFAAALTKIGLPDNAIPLALALFNVGVEIGQLLFVFAFVVLGWALSRLQFNPLVGWNRLPAYFIGSLASFWLIERTAGFFI